MKLWPALVFLLCAGAARAQPLDAPQQAWQALTRADVAAALDLIETNHPGAAPELGDMAFRQALARARANAQRRLPLVKDFGGHAALMLALANEFGDGHIMTNSLFSRSRRRWSGLMIARSGGQWVVGAQEAAPGEPDLRGATLVGCDGVAADRMALDLLGTFYVNPKVDAATAKEAPNLLLDHNNPFVRLPDRCQFRRADGAIVGHVLQWRPVSAQNLQRAASNSYQPARAGMGVSTFAAGHWIGLENLSNDAANVVSQVRAQQSALRASPMVVLDLRGNSGGNSQYAEEIAIALVGDARVRAVSSPPTRCSGMYWRVSKDNASALRNFANSLPADRAAEWKAQADDLEKAVTAGRTFSPDLPACARAETTVERGLTGKLLPAAMQGRLVLLTDRACFSSCLMAADLFRRLGALHVGEATDMSTRYMEIRDIILPSGLRTFSTLQKVAIGTGDYGPYAPRVVYPGPLHEDDKLKAWVAALPR